MISQQNVFDVDLILTIENRDIIRTLRSADHIALVCCLGPGPVGHWRWLDASPELQDTKLNDGAKRPTDRYCRWVRLLARGWNHPWGPWRWRYNSRIIRFIRWIFLVLRKNLWYSEVSFLQISERTIFVGAKKGTKWSPNSADLWRTETFAWIREELVDGEKLTVDNKPVTLDSDSVPAEEITAFVTYRAQNGTAQIFRVSYDFCLIFMCHKLWFIVGHF